MTVPRQRRGDVGKFPSASDIRMQYDIDLLETHAKARRAASQIIGNMVDSDDEWRDLLALGLDVLGLMPDDATGD